MNGRVLTRNWFELGRHNARPRRRRSGPPLTRGTLVPGVPPVGRTARCGGGEDRVSGGGIVRRIQRLRDDGFASQRAGHAVVAARRAQPQAAA